MRTRNERFIAIGDYVQGKTIFTIPMIEEQNSQILGGDICPGGDNRDVHTQPICN